MQFLLNSECSWYLIARIAYEIINSYHLCLSDFICFQSFRFDFNYCYDGTSRIIMTIDSNLNAIMNCELISVVLILISFGFQIFKGEIYLNIIDYVYL